MRGPKDQHSSPDKRVREIMEEEEEEEGGELQGEESVTSDKDYDTDLELSGIDFFLLLFLQKRDKLRRSY